MNEQKPAMTFVEHVVCDAILMALYIHGYERPTFMDEHIEHCRRTFGIRFKRWETKSEWGTGVPGSREPLMCRCHLEEKEE